MAAALAIAASQSPPYMLCAFLFKVFYDFSGDKWRNRYVSPPQDFREGCHLKILGQDFAKRAHFRPSENLGKNFRQRFYPKKVKRNFVEKILGKIKIFGQDFVPIRTAPTVIILEY